MGQSGKVVRYPLIPQNHFRGLPGPRLAEPLYSIGLRNAGRVHSHSRRTRRRTSSLPGCGSPQTTVARVLLYVQSLSFSIRYAVPLCTPNDHHSNCTVRPHHPLATQTPATIAPRVRSVQPAALRWRPARFRFTRLAAFATCAVYRKRVKAKAFLDGVGPSSTLRARTVGRPDPRESKLNRLRRPCHTLGTLFPDRALRACSRTWCTSSLLLAAARGCPSGEWGYPRRREVEGSARGRYGSLFHGGSHGPGRRPLRSAHCEQVRAGRRRDVDLLFPGRSPEGRGPIVRASAPRLENQLGTERRMG